MRNRDTLAENRIDAKNTKKGDKANKGRFLLDKFKIATGASCVLSVLESRTKPGHRVFYSGMLFGAGCFVSVE